MAQPDYDNDLVFPPQPVFPTIRKNLNEAWKAEKLKSGWYYTLMTSDEITPNLWFDDEWDDFRGNVMEILAPCDYKELLQLKEENDTLIKRCGNLERQGAGTRIAFESERIVNERLRNLLRECKEALEEFDLNYYGTSYGNHYKGIITRINAAIGEEE